MYIAKKDCGSGDTSFSDIAQKKNVNRPSVPDRLPAGTQPDAERKSIEKENCRNVFVFIAAFEGEWARENERHNASEHGGYIWTHIYLATSNIDVATHKWIYILQSTYHLGTRHFHEIYTILCAGKWTKNIYLDMWIFSYIFYLKTEYSSVIYICEMILDIIESFRF